MLLSLHKVRCDQRGEVSSCFQDTVHLIPNDFIKRLVRNWSPVLILACAECSNFTCACYHLITSLIETSFHPRVFGFFIIEILVCLSLCSDHGSSLIIVKDVLSHDTEVFRSELGLLTSHFALSNILNIFVLCLANLIELFFALVVFPLLFFFFGLRFTFDTSHVNPYVRKQLLESFFISFRSFFITVEICLVLEFFCKILAFRFESKDTCHVFSHLVPTLWRLRLYNHLYFLLIVLSPILEVERFLRHIQP